MTEKDRIIDVLFICLCALLLLSVGICVYALPKKDFSEEENRALADMPNASVSSLVSGEFFEGLSDFYSDNIPLRSQIISVKAVCELSLGKQQNNNVIFCRDGRLVDRCRYNSTDTLNKNLDSIRRFSQEYGNTVCRIVPRSVDVCTMPSPLYSSEEARRITDTVKQAGIYDESFVSLLSADSYYKTDHHLTSKGAYMLYRSLADELSFAPYEITDFTVTQVSKDFLGSTYSKAGLIAAAYDTIELFRYQGDEDYTVFCNDNGCSLCSIYEMSKLSQKDKYQVFLGGNHGLISISSNDGAPKPRLLIIKDSFANAVIPFLARHFDLTVVDPRYCNTSLSNVLDSSFYDCVLFLCGIDTLATNGAFKRILR